MRSTRSGWAAALILALALSACDDGDDTQGTGGAGGGPSADRGLIALADDGVGGGSADAGRRDAALPACSDGIDNDDDGLIDLDDRGCEDADDTNELGPPACSDGVDNDFDGETDFPADPGCAGPQDEDEFNEPVLPRCNDGIDNDRDGYVDEQDPGCRSIADDDEENPDEIPVCFDKRDNDGDGLVDFPLDPGCSAAGDDDEADGRVPACINGLDDDEDGRIDYPDDPGCLGAGDNSEEDKPLAPQCADGQDNDRDGRTDYPDDVECFAASDPSERGPCGSVYSPPLLSNGETLVVDTSRGLFESAGSCGGLGSPETVVFYRLDRPVEALVVSTEGGGTTVPTTLYVRRGVCLDADPLVELGCQREAENPAVPGHTLTVPNVAAGDYYIVIDGVAGEGGEVAVTVTEVPLAQCLNRLDDDGDGRVDYPEDPGCSQPTDRDEADPAEAPLCANDEDDDGDGQVDYPLDVACVSAAWDDETDVCGPGVPFLQFFPSDTEVLGSTRAEDGASNNHVGSCGGQGTPERVYRFRNPTPGRLTISTAHPESDPGTLVYVRRDCNDRLTELSCDDGSRAGTDNGRISFEAQAAVYWIIVDTTRGVGGDFKLSIEREAN